MDYCGGGDKQQSPPDTPKGCVAVVVGGSDEEQKRFVIPLAYLKHPSFLPLLKDAAEEYGFVHDGPVNIPCRVDKFRRVQRVIQRETAASAGGGIRSCWSGCFKIKP